LYEDEVLWMDDLPEDGVLYRACMMDAGINVITAGSVAEATRCMRSTGYDALFLRPDIKVSGASTVCLETEHNRNPAAPYLRELVDFSFSSPNAQSPLYLLRFNRDIAEPNNSISHAIESLGLSPERLFRGGKDLYFRDIRPSRFGYDIAETILERRLKQLREQRLEQRVDG